jgi:NAD(P)-dependent dehydrogenase (short-subunit alcohol dehydrogenase family)
MTGSDASGTPALVTGASRGFGRTIAVALHGTGAAVVAVARNSDRLDEVRDLDQYVEHQAAAVEPEQVGSSIAGLASSPDPASAYLLTPSGLSSLP